MSTGALMRARARPLPKAPLQGLVGQPSSAVWDGSSALPGFAHRSNSDHALAPHIYAHFAANLPVCVTAHCDRSRVAGVSLKSAQRLSIEHRPRDQLSITLAAMSAREVAPWRHSPYSRSVEATDRR